MCQIAVGHDSSRLPKSMVSAYAATLKVDCAKTTTAGMRGILLKMNEKHCVFATAPLMVFTLDVSPLFPHFIFYKVIGYRVLHLSGDTVDL